MTNYIIIAIGPLCWGKGLSIDAAISEAAKGWPRFIRDHKPSDPRCYKLIFSTDPAAYINESGSLCYARTAETIILNEPTRFR